MELDVDANIPVARMWTESLESTVILKSDGRTASYDPTTRAQRTEDHCTLRYRSNSTLDTFF